MKKIPETELEIMLKFWEADKPLCSFDIRELFPEKNWALTTVSTLLSRLENKDYIKSTKKGKVKYYTPLVDRDEYAQRMSRNVLEKFFGNSLQKFVACLASNNDISEKDLKELQVFLDEQKANNP